MTPSIVFRCPSCSARIKAPTQLIGQTRICPGCGSQFIIRPPIPEDAGPLLSLENATPARKEKALYRSV